MNLPDYRSARVLVVGDLMLDQYWHGNTSRISPEAPVPVVHIQQAEERPGGAGNVALNIAALGAKAFVVGLCGDDEAGQILINELGNANVECKVRQIKNLATVTKLRVLSRHQQLIRLDFEDGFYDVSPLPLLDDVKSYLRESNVVVLSDYGKGTLGAAREIIQIARAEAKFILVDPKGEDFSIYRGATIITPNFNEFEAVAGPCSTDQDIVDKAMSLIKDLQVGAVLITRGEHGMSLISRDQKPLHLPTKAREVYDVTGAGDTVISVLAASLAARETLSDATRLANLAAGIVVGKLGTAAVTADELKFGLRGRQAHHRGIIKLNALLEILEAARSNGEKIVATNGCFDILHPGHLHYLKRAKALGDRLVVMVNSDGSVIRLKGPKRPINRLDHRMEMVAALECVDWVVAFDDETPERIISKIVPDILVKGGDYKDIREIAGHQCVVENGGEVKILEYVNGFSTSQIIRSICAKVSGDAL